MITEQVLTFLLYLFYGMAFFAIGVAITSRDTRASNLAISGAMWFLALFAYSHAFHEWFELYQNLPAQNFPEQYFPQATLFKLVLVFVSFTFLFLFGIRLLKICFPAQAHLIYVVPLLMMIGLVVYIFPVSLPITQEEFFVINCRIRNFIGFPAALSAGLGLIFYSRTVEHISARGSRNFIGAGVAFLTYGILTGIIPSRSALPFLDLPIELFRGVSAFIILHFVMHALYVFDEERKLLTEERLNRFAKSEKLHALGKLAFGIAHEINNPLTNVSMNVEMLKNDLGHLAQDERVTRRFDTIERNLDRASKIARELLLFSSEKSPEFTTTSLNDVIDSTLELLGARRTTYQISVNHGIIPEIDGIPWKLEEVFLNLLVNAMDATPEGGRIEITTSLNYPHVVAQLTDNGKGIPEELLIRVMDPFFTTKEIGKGTGLGLSICYGIMDLHGGAIEVNSRVGQGTTVTVTFPVKGTKNG